MSKYLDKFRGTLEQRQSDQIFKLLHKQRISGQIRTVEEFTQRLDTLIRELTSTVIQPSLKPFLAASNAISSSEQFNHMLDRTQDDLIAGFEEANNISEVQTSHETLVRDVVLKNLRAGVAELESKISLYEFMNQDPRGFDSSIFSTFRESKEERTSRGDSTNSLFVDPRTKELIPISQDATVELVGERLTLATSDKAFHTIHGIRQLFDSESPQSDKIVTPPDVKLSNIIDGQTGTFWTQSWLFPEAQPYVKAQLELDFGVARDINFIEIEPVTTLGFFLEAVFYLDSNNVFQDLGLSEQFLTGTTGLRIKKTSTRKLILVFRNENGYFTNFEFSDKDTLLNQSQERRDDPTLGAIVVGDISRDLDTLVTSSKIKEIIGVTAEEKQIYQGYEFTIGFDNIRVGLATYEDTSIYVSAPLETSATSMLGLKVLENRPYVDSNNVVRFTETTYDTDDDIDFVGSIEYWIVKQDLNIAGALVRTSIFPILPLDINRIHHERLILTEKSLSTLSDNDVGQLMFYTTWHRDGSGNPIPNEPDGEIVVYRNGIVLPNVDGVPLPSEGWVSTSTTAADKTPNASNPMNFKIKIIGGLVGDIYTVTYTPTVSTTMVIPKPPYATVDYIGGLQIVDLVGDLSARRIAGQVVIAEELGGYEGIENSRCFCVIVMRQNTAEASISPAVEEYTLFAGYYDPTKFSGD